MRKCRTVGLVAASRRPLALIAALACALSMGRPDVAQAEDFRLGRPEPR